MNERLTILCGDALEKLRELPEKSVHCCVTSPPYWGLRDYKVPPTNWQEVIYKPMPGLPQLTIPALTCCLGDEPTPEAFTGHLVLVFREVWRVLRDDGTFWLNLGDSYANTNRGHNSNGAGNLTGSNLKNKLAAAQNRSTTIPEGLKPKDLIGIPWRIALALQADGWYLRSDIIWAKRNCMPESVTDRPTRSHEFLFLLTKSERYFYDAEAIKEPCIYDVDGPGTAARKARATGNKLLPTGEINGIRPAKRHQLFPRDHPETSLNSKFSGADKQRGHSRRHDGFNGRWDAMEKEEQCTGMRNKRDVWTIGPANYPEAHFATYPPKLIEPCILAGTSAKGCCPSCGAPWERVVEKSGERDCHSGNKKFSELTKTRRGEKSLESSFFKDGKVGTFETTGWQPTCDCNSGLRTQDSGLLTPCTVLDPFGGSGTTPAVALSHGRAAIVIELNPNYIPLIEARTNITPGLALA